MKNKIIVLFALVLIPAKSVFADSSIELNCSATSSTVAITNVGTSTINVFFDWNQEDVYDLEKSVEGDCAGRGLFDCYQNGQMMINIPKSLGLGKKITNRIWVNLDTDDDTSNGRLGESYNCK